MSDPDLGEVNKTFDRLRDLCNTLDVALVAQRRNGRFELLSARLTAGATTGRQPPRLVQGEEWFALRVSRSVGDFATLIDWTRSGRAWSKLLKGQPGQVVLSEVPRHWFSNGFGRSRVAVFGACPQPMTANGGTTWGRIFRDPHAYREWVSEIESMDEFHDLAAFVDAFALRQPFYSNTDVCQLHAEVEFPLYEQTTHYGSDSTTLRFVSPMTSCTDLKAKWKRGSQTGLAALKVVDGFVEVAIDGPPASCEVALVYGDQPIAKVYVPAPPPKPAKPAWSDLDAGEFERSIFDLLAGAPGYENPKLLTNTNAADRARDIEVFRVHKDSLGGTIRHRVIVQCKHWRTKPIAVTDVAEALAKMQLWERVDVLLIATSGRLTNDAVQWIEQHNKKSVLPTIEVWNDVHLEQLGVASRP